MIVARSVFEARAARQFLGEMALVPTMGALHEGHLSLIRIAREHARNVAVSIFVNPTQFGPREDFTKYPRPLVADLNKCREAGVALVFNPTLEEMYPPPGYKPIERQPEPEMPLFTSHLPKPALQLDGRPAASPSPPAQVPSALLHLPDIIIDLPSLTTVLEGKHRPGHFKGVCLAVAKLFHILTPDFACFGQKDYQQLRVITTMVETLNLPIKIIPCPTVREPDGLAMSSRNQHLSSTERQRALAIPKALFQAERDVKAGIRQTNRLTATMQHILMEQHLNIDYVAAVEPLTLKPVLIVSGHTVLAVAARVGNTRLIDNLLVVAQP